MSELPTAGRRVRESASEISELAMPMYANPHGSLFGGRVMHLVDTAAALAAMRHSRQTVVTASIDHMRFLVPIRIGEQVTCKASVNRVFTTSMEIGVKVLVENLRTGEIRHTSSAYLTFVAIDSEGQRLKLEQVVPETPDEIRRWEKAAERRQFRLEMKAKDKATPG